MSILGGAFMVGFVSSFNWFLQRPIAMWLRPFWLHRRNCSFTVAILSFSASGSDPRKLSSWGFGSRYYPIQQKSCRNLTAGGRTIGIADENGAAEIVDPVHGPAVKLSSEPAT